MGGVQTSGSEVVPSDAPDIDDLPEVRLLTVGMRSLLLGYLTTGDKIAANRLAGYERDSDANSSWRSRRMQAAIKAVADAELRGPAVLKAVRTMTELMDEKPGRSDTVRIKAAAWVLDAAALGAKSEGDGLAKKKLSDMTAEELGQFIESQRGIIANGGPVIDVTPNK